MPFTILTKHLYNSQLPKPIVKEEIIELKNESGNDGKKESKENNDMTVQIHQKRESRPPKRFVALVVSILNDRFVHFRVSD